MSSVKKVAVLQRFVDSYSTDLLALHAAFVDPSTPTPAKCYLIGGLNYGLDRVDMLPDAKGSLGIADDAIVLRITAKLAIAAGAKHPALRSLARDVKDIDGVFDDLSAPLEKLVADFPKRTVRGRNADQILGDAASRSAFDADVNHEAAKFTPAPIATDATAAQAALDELYRAIKDTLIRYKIT